MCNWVVLITGGTVAVFGIYMYMSKLLHCLSRLLESIMFNLRAIRLHIYA